MSPDANEQDLLYFNGINGDSGDYDLPPMTSDELSEFIQGVSEPENLNELRFRYQQASTDHFGVKEGVDPKKLEESGWGIIFAHDADPAVKEALSELIACRREQAGDYFRLYEGSEGYRTDEPKSKFLARHGAGPGPADPNKVPYYLLIVGDPEKIPYRFQSQLDVQYAVGRVHFDSLDEYANYARSVVAAESGKVKINREAAFFAVANEDDRSTQLSQRHLVSPLYDKFTTEEKDWRFTAYLADEATKGQLGQLLNNGQTPALLFSASHGVSFPMGSQRQLAHQGAILCQDWPGPRQWRGKGTIPEEFYFAGDDLESNANLLGLISFFFACYGGGTPKLDEFAKQAFKQREAIAPHAFLARLPLKMLSQPRGGALAVIGHVERAWGYSFVWPGAGAQTTVFESTLKRLMDGHPVGSAIEYFNERYAELSTVLSDELEEIEFGKMADPYELSGMWTANNDARGYAIIGDPAVRLPLIQDDESPERPSFEVRAAKPAGEESAASAASPVEEPAPDPPQDETPASFGVTREADPAEGAPPVAGTGRPPKQSEKAPVGVSSPDPVATSNTQAQPAPTREADDLDFGGDLSFAPLPEISADYRTEHPELYQAWVNHIKVGYEGNNQVFQRILNTFLRSHNVSLVMYIILFLFGIAFFGASIALAFVREDFLPSAVFAGIGAASFITYFVGRSTQSIEENLEFITWLGIIYNSYWTRLAWTFDQGGAPRALDKATSQAVEQLERLIDRHAEATGKRPKLERQELIQTTEAVGEG